MAFEKEQILVRKAARALARAGLVNAYGHCSTRLDADSFLVCAPRPMGLIRPGQDGHVVPIDGALPEGVLGEVRAHQQIYKRRPDVGGICRILSPKILSISATGRTPEVRHGFGSYFAPRAPLWDDPSLMRDDAKASGLAETLGKARAVIMRGNGAVVAGETLEQAVVLAWFLEDAARVELDVQAAGGQGPILSQAQAEQRATFAGLIVERMWEYLTDGDPE
jgi:HCOMODA/2-hydroxy-3-carboxy-muconic semialdehyde decarboxylase